MKVRAFIRWAGWTMQDYLTTPADIVAQWEETWLAEANHHAISPPKQS